jgi:hypothetical protein
MKAALLALTQALALLHSGVSDETPGPALP